MINIKVMTNFGIELLTYGHVPGSNRDKTFVRIKALKLSRHMTLRKKVVYKSLKLIIVGFIYTFWYFLSSTTSILE